MTLVPAYGRDYKSKKAVEADWLAGKDFIVSDMFSQWDGKPYNLESAQYECLKYVNIRYKRLAQIARVKVP